MERRSRLTARCHVAHCSRSPRCQSSLIACDLSIPRQLARYRRLITMCDRQLFRMVVTSTPHSWLKVLPQRIWHDTARHRLVTPLNNRRYINNFIYLSIYLSIASGVTRCHVHTGCRTARYGIVRRRADRVVSDPV